MAVRSARLFSLAVTSTSFTTAYTVPTGKTIILRTLWVVNESLTAASTFGMRVNVGPGAQTFVLEEPIPAKGRYVSDHWLAFDEGDVLSVRIALAGGANLMVWGFGALLDGVA